jgi:curved DNA-binding protein CbpA
METSEFIDYYEILEISPNANSGTVERMFRHLAKRYHPDNQDTGDRLRFQLILDANETLKDPAKRAQYDIHYKSYSGSRFKLVEEASNSKSIETDADVQKKLLSILYIKRRQNIRNPGIGDLELEHLLDCPAEHLEFHLWYLKAKGWIGKTEQGTVAITAEGVDRAHSERHGKTAKRLLTNQSDTG